MRIVSKKTGLHQEILSDQWEEMKTRGEHRMFTIEDASDEDLSSVEIKVEPIPMINDDLADESPKSEVEAEKDFIKGELDKAGVYYQQNTGIKKLREKFEKLNKETDE